MKNLSTQETLLTALPILLVLIALIGAVIFIPEGSILDIRGRAARVATAPTIVPLPTPTEPLEVACSELYNPVCGVDSQTYNNTCEAEKANALPIIPSECPVATITPGTSPSY